LELVLETLNEQGMLTLSDESITLPTQGSEQSFQFANLANLMNETLARMYLVVNFARFGDKDQTALSLASGYAAEKISILLGIKGPDFFEQKLTDNYIEQLIERGLLVSSNEGVLKPTETFFALGLSLEAGIDAKLKFAIDAEIAAPN
jgi:glycerol-3-phosphate O-acyltransferase